MDEVKIWALEDGSETKLLESKSHTDSESRLEDAIVMNPDLLEEGLILIGRQTQTEGGPLDLLGVDRDGRLVLFELKRGNVTRDAVAQILDYASDLESKNLDSLGSYISEQSGKHGIEKIEDFAEWYGQAFDEQDLESLRPLRMFLIGLGVDARTERMVTFMANKGMDISLLTFHAFAHDGKTFLARQVHVDPPDDSQSSVPKPPLSRAEKMENLREQARKNGVLELFTDAEDMFRKNWPVSMDIAPGKVSLTIRLRETFAGKRRTRSYARIGPVWGKVVILVFYPSAVALCVPEFDQLSQKISFQTSPPDRDLGDGDVEAQFILAPDDWETHKDELYALTKAVYEAWQEEQKGT